MLRENDGLLMAFHVSALPLFCVDERCCPTPPPTAFTATTIATAPLFSRAAALILVGNKSDMSSKQREVSMMEGIRFARKYGLNFVEVGSTTLVLFHVVSCHATYA